MEIYRYYLILSLIFILSFFFILETRKARKIEKLERKNIYKYIIYVFVFTIIYVFFISVLMFFQIISPYFLGSSNFIYILIFNSILFSLFPVITTGYVYKKRSSIFSALLVLFGSISFLSFIWTFIGMFCGVSADFDGIGVITYTVMPIFYGSIIAFVLGVLYLIYIKKSKKI